uniref:Putative secreted protein n=1 Tax=Ixodes ricinus TaxID=34613 RepID=A0A6B0UQT8_IXORI
MARLWSCFSTCLWRASASGRKYDAKNASCVFLTLSLKMGRSQLRSKSRGPSTPMSFSGMVSSTGPGPIVLMAEPMALSMTALFWELDESRISPIKRNDSFMWEWKSLPRTSKHAAHTKRTWSQTGENW